MIKLLRTNFFKMVHSWSFWIPLLILPLFNIFTIIDRDDYYLGLVPNSGILRWNLAQCGESCFAHMSLFNYLAVILVGMLIGDEYSSHTIRNKLISGYSRTELYISYLITAVSECFIVHIFTVIVSYAVCTVRYGIDRNFGIFEHMITDSLITIAAIAVFMVFCIAAAGDRTIGMIISFFTNVVVVDLISGSIEKKLYLNFADISEKKHNILVIIHSIMPSSYMQWFYSAGKLFKYLNVTKIPSSGWCCIWLIIFAAAGAVVIKRKDLK